MIEFMNRMVPVSVGIRWNDELLSGFRVVVVLLLFLVAKCKICIYIGVVQIE